MKKTLQRIKNKIKTTMYSPLKADIALYVDMDYKVSKLQMYNGIRNNSCAKEPETVRWIEGFEKTDIVYDIGACVGAYSLIASKYAKEVYAFEPAFFNYYIMMKNITRNVSKHHIENNIIPIYGTLSLQTAIGTFNYASLDNGSSLHVLDKKIDYKGEEFKPVFSQRILSLSLDDFVKYFKAPVPNHIKLDVDGNEYDILCGATEILKCKELKSLLIEIDIGRSDDKIVGLLEKNGFKLSEKTVRSEKVANYVFVRC